MSTWSWTPPSVHMRPPGPNPLCVDIINGWPISGLKKVPVTFLWSGCMFFEKKTSKLRLTLSLKAYLLTYISKLSIYNSVASIKDKLKEGNLIYSTNAFHYDQCVHLRKLESWNSLPFWDYLGLLVRTNIFKDEVCKILLKTNFIR